jgi:uncharacterized membrane protein YkvA (DUF1232 family)
MCKKILNRCCDSEIAEFILFVLFLNINYFNHNFQLVFWLKINCERTIRLFTFERSRKMYRTKITPEEARAEIRQGQSQFTEKDLVKVLGKADEVKDKFKSSGKLRHYLEEVKLLYSLIRDYINGRYKEIPWWMISSIGVALLYVLNPFDIIPDFIPFVGYVDDALIVGICINLIRKDLDKYRVWAQHRGYNG